MQVEQFVFPKQSCLAKCHISMVVTLSRDFCSNDESEICVQETHHRHKCNCHETCIQETVHQEERKVDYGFFYRCFGPQHKVMEYEDQVLRTVLARSQQTHGEVARQQYNHTRSSTKSNHNFLQPHPSYSCYNSSKGYTSRIPIKTLQHGYNRSANINLLCMQDPTFTSLRPNKLHLFRRCGQTFLCII